MTEEEFLQHLEQSDKCNIVALDTETTGLSVVDGRDYCVGVSIAYYIEGKINSAYFPFRHDKSSLPLHLVDKLNEWVQGRTLCLANSKFDIHSLKTLGVHLTGTLWDVLGMSNLLNENLPYKDLDKIARYYIKKGKEGKNHVTTLREVVGSAAIPVEIMELYAKIDAEITLELFRYLHKALTKQNLTSGLQKYESDLTYALVDMEKNGIKVDINRCDMYSSAAILRMEDIVNTLGFKPAGNALANFIFNELELPVLYVTDKGNPSLNKKAMEEYDIMLSRINDKSAQLVLAFRGWEKANSSSYAAWPRCVSPDGRIHTNFKTSQTVTGRLSSEKPNLQQIPKQSNKEWNGKMKTLFVPEPDFELWEFDYKQLEFRLASIYGKDPSLIDDWTNERDPYQQIADLLNISRDRAKTLVLALSYSAGVTKVSFMLGVDGTTGARIVRDFHKQYPGLQSAIKTATSQATAQGYIKYWTGRKRHYNSWNSDDAYAAFNSLCQGGGFELVKRKIIETNKFASDDARPVLTVHDSVVWEIRKDRVNELVPSIKDAMEYRTEFKVPFIIDAHQWGKG